MIIIMMMMIHEYARHAVSSLNQDATVTESEASNGQNSLVTSHQNISLYFSYVSGCKIPISMANEEDNKMEKHMDTEQKVKKRIILAFGVIGFLVDFFFSTYQSAAQDIFEATNIPTPWITLSIAAPACLVTFIYPYVFQRIPVSVACFVLFIASVTGILLTSLAQDLRVRLSGVCLVSFGIGSMEAVFLSLSSVYGGRTVHSYSMGSALSFVAGPLLYAGR